LSLNPYRSLPDHRFWRKAIANVPSFATDLMVEAPFLIAPTGDFSRASMSDEFDVFVFTFGLTETSRSTRGGKPWLPPRSFARRRSTRSEAHEER
jgi:hypothetical protein